MNLEPAEMLKTRVRKMRDRTKSKAKMTNDDRRELVSAASARYSAADVDFLQFEMGRSFDHPAWNINPNDQPLNLCERSSLWR